MLCNLGFILLFMSYHVNQNSHVLAYLEWPYPPPLSPPSFFHPSMQDVEQLLNFIGVKSLGPRHVLANLKELLMTILCPEYIDTWPELQYWLEVFVNGLFVFLLRCKFLMEHLSIHPGDLSSRAMQLFCFCEYYLEISCYILESMFWVCMFYLII